MKYLCTYVDHDRGDAVIFELACDSILHADGVFESEYGYDPKNAKNIGVRVEVNREIV